MRYADRSKISTPPLLTGKNSAGVKETKLVCAWHAASAAKRKTLKKTKFAAYASGEVRLALHQLFHGKCAYCESQYAPTQPVDVEHYRPKSQVAESKKHAGYYWLAASWDNLLPSCIDCNRVRKQKYWISSPNGGQGAPQNMGKGTQFPIQDEQHRAFSHNQPMAEVPLLLNPCVDEPTKHLQFWDDAVLIPKTGSDAFVKSRAQKSIEIYGLNRTALVKARRETLLLLQARFYAITRLTELASLVHHQNQTIRDLVDDLLAFELRELKRFTDPERPYSQMCRDLVRRFKATLRRLGP